MMIPRKVWGPHVKPEAEKPTSFHPLRKGVVGRFVRFCCTFGGDLFVDFFWSWSGFTYGCMETLTSWEDPNVCLSFVSVDPQAEFDEYAVPSMILRDSAQR